jgi:hypothetical protein
MELHELGKWYLLIMSVISLLLKNTFQGYPIVTNSIRDCVEFNSDQTNVQMAQKWRNVDCNQHKEFVCEVILSQG